METNLIGDKSRFAIEFSEVVQEGWEPPVGAPIYGTCGVWLAGHNIHEEGNPIYLDSMISTFQYLVNAEIRNADQLPAATSADELQTAIRQEEDLSPHWFLQTEGFDDFLTLFAKGPEYTTFLWAVRPSVTKQDLDEYRNYPKDVQKAVIKNEDIRPVVEGFVAAINAIHEKKKNRQAGMQSRP